MSPLSNSVYSSVFTYNPNVLIRQYRHLTTKASIELHHITCVTLDISILIVRFGDRACACRVDTPTSHPRTNSPPFSTKVSWLFDKLSDNNASDDGLFLSASVAVNKQISEVIPMPGNNAILVVYQGSHLNLLYLTGSFLIGYMKVRYSLLYYVLLILLTECFSCTILYNYQLIAGDCTA